LIAAAAAAAAAPPFHYGDEPIRESLFKRGDGASIGPQDRNEARQFKASPGTSNATSQFFCQGISQCR